MAQAQGNMLIIAYLGNANQSRSWDPPVLRGLGHRAERRKAVGKGARLWWGAETGSAPGNQ